MPLYQNRQRMERLAQGEAGPLTLELTKEVRTRIFRAMVDSCPGEVAEPSLRELREYPRWPEIGAAIFEIVTRDWGRLDLLDWSRQKKAAQGVERHHEVTSYLLNKATADEVRDMIEAWFQAVSGEMGYVYGGATVASKRHAEFTARCNEILDQHAIAFHLADGRTLDRDSMELHREVVQATVALLHGRPDLEAVQRAYMKALQELRPGGDPADAITDAGTALQEMLVALGAEGNALGPLIKDAQRRGLLGPYDSKLADGLRLIGDWVSAERSTRGDAHSAAEPSRDEAWLAVHVTGALVLFLAGSSSPT